MNFPHVVLARLYDHVEPIDRGNRYEDPLQAQLDPRHAGRVTGGGSQLNADGAIDYADIEIELADLDDAVRLTERLLQPSSYTVRRLSALVVRGRADVDGGFFDALWTTVTDDWLFAARDAHGHGIGNAGSSSAP